MAKKNRPEGRLFFSSAETGYFLVSVVVVVEVPGVVVVVDLVVSAVPGMAVVEPDGVVVVVLLPGAVVVVVLLVLLAGGAVGASAGFTSTLVAVVGAGVTSVLVQPTTPKAMTAARIKGDFIVRVPSAGWLFDLRHGRSRVCNAL